MKQFPNTLHKSNMTDDSDRDSLQVSLQIHLNELIRRMCGYFGYSGIYRVAKNP